MYLTEDAVTVSVRTFAKNLGTTPCLGWILLLAVPSFLVGMHLHRMTNKLLIFGFKIRLDKGSFSIFRKTALFRISLILNFQLTVAFEMAGCEPGLSIKLRTGSKF